MPTESMDIVIAGGGMVGASLAAALSSLQLKVALIEASPVQLTQQPGYDDRAIALSYGSSQTLKGMGVWKSVAEVANPIDSIHVSDRGHFGATRLNAKQQKVPALGYLIQAQAYGHAINSFLEASDVRILQPAKIDALETTGAAQNISVMTKSGIETIKAKLLVACDGGNSEIRKMSGVSATTHDYEQVAIIANVTTEVPHENRAFERFTEQGPIALLPMSDNRCSLVWTLNADNYQSVLDLDDDAFLKALGEAFGYRLGRFTRVGRRSSFPLMLTQSSQLTSERLAIIGNAAHALHPVAGQGLNLALRDIAELAEQIAVAVKDDKDVGSAELLNAYAGIRQKDTARTIKYTDSLVKLFSNQNFLLGHARAAGLTLVDRLVPLRTLLAKQSMGLASRPSRLARGLPLLKESL
jgi:2-octaprenyl-6-methoxyphenol hydroxylase